MLWNLSSPCGRPYPPWGAERGGGRDWWEVGRRGGRQRRELTCEANLFQVELIKNVEKKETSG